MGDAGIASVACRHGGAGNERRVRVDRDVALVSIEAARRRFVPMTRLGVDRRDDAVRCDSTRDSEHAVVECLKVLTHHCRHELGGLLQLRRERSSIELRKHCVGVSRERIDECFTRRFVVPIASRLARTVVVVVAVEHSAKQGDERLRGCLQQRSPNDDQRRNKPPTWTPTRMKTRTGDEDGRRGCGSRIKTLGSKKPLT